MSFRPDDWQDDDPAVITYAVALESIRDLAFCYSQKFGEQQTRAIVDGAHPEIVEFERVFVRRMRKLGVPMFAHCIVRGEHDQNAAFVAGHSKVRYPNSAHNHGCAVDLIHGTKAWSLPRKSWETIGHVGKEAAKAKGIKIKWGGDFDTLWDPAHWELENWRERARELA